MMDWIIGNYLEVLAVWAAVVGVAQLIVRLTPNQKDDTLVAKIGAWTQRIRNLLTLQKPNAPTRDQQ